MSDEFDEHDLEGHSVNLAKVSDCTDMLAVTRILAMDMQSNPYTTVGHFIKNLTYADLMTLAEIDSSTDDFQNIILIAEMLASAEGVMEKTLDDVTQRASMMMTFLTCETLYRKGMVDVFHDNMSFGDDSGEKIIVKKKE